MKRLLFAAMALALIAVPVNAQSLEDLNIQIHGYATQGFLYTTTNNIFTTDSSDGSPSWTETVVNVTSRPDPKLRIAVQARYFLLGNVGNAITLDYAAADYTVNEKFGIRFGKVKTPSMLFNEIQDVDPSYLWALLPQGVYSIESRNSFLSHYGGVVYGSINLGEKMGKLQYRGWGGERVLSSNDGFFINQREGGLVLTNGLSVGIVGATLRWKTPLPGLTLGATDDKQRKSTPAMTLGPLSGTEIVPGFNTPNFFAIYEKKKLTVAGEYFRTPVKPQLVLTGIPVIRLALDQRAWYAMASYKLTDKLSAGIYQSQLIDHQAALGPARYSKDWAISGRYDFNQFLYAKAEQHFIDGTAIGYDITENPPSASLPTGLLPTSKFTVLKIGVSF